MRVKAALLTLLGSECQEMTTPEKSPTRDHPEELPSSKNEKATIELENQYEHKLALELERFDDLSKK